MENNDVWLKIIWPATITNKIINARKPGQALFTKTCNVTHGSQSVEETK
jgi:hypothetical protein